MAMAIRIVMVEVMSMPERKYPAAPSQAQNRICDFALTRLSLTSISERLGGRTSEDLIL
jgi:hypothetical protein